MSKANRQINSYPLIFVILGITILFTTIGAIVSPVDALSGKPVLYTPSRRRLSDIQQAYTSWLQQIDSLEQEIPSFLNGSDNDLLTASMEIDALLFKTQELRDQINFTKNEFPNQSPLISISVAIERYYLTVESVKLYHLNPTDENLEAALIVFTLAQEQRKSLSEVRWNLTQ